MIQPALTIYAWNEYMEGGIVAPTMGEGWTKLKGIAAVFGSRSDPATRIKVDDSDSRSRQW